MNIQRSLTFVLDDKLINLRLENKYTNYWYVTVGRGQPQGGLVHEVIGYLEEKFGLNEIDKQQLERACESICPLKPNTYRPILEKILSEYVQVNGIDSRLAIRDLLADVKCIADEDKVDFQEQLELALVVAKIYQKEQYGKVA